MTGQHQPAVAHSLPEARRDGFTGMKGKVDYGREPDYAVLPTKIVANQIGPRRSRRHGGPTYLARDSGVRAGRVVAGHWRR